MQRQLLSTNSFIFIAVLIIAIILAIIYHVLAVDRPTDLQQFNRLNPFPTIRMKHVPPPEFTYTNPDIKDCTKQILSCDNDNDCKNCGTNFTCTPVDESENLVVGGNKIGTGNWCLPKNKLSGCGKYTGQVVWSGDEQGEGWACICKYPDLFTGETCLENKACKDTSIVAGGIDQSNNNLANSSGEVYDPNLPNFYPPNSEANPYARENIYDKDGNLVTDVLGKPIYTCSCGTGGGKTFVSLPNDPQGCNLDPCTPSHSSPLWNEQNQTCICGINGVIKSEDGTCIERQCPYGYFNPVTGTCDCLGHLGKMRCHTDKIRWGTPTPGCEDPENPAGTQCVDRCIYKYCQSENPDECGWIREGDGFVNKGYRPEHFDEANSAVCIGGTCEFSNNNRDVKCQCPENTAYDDSPGSDQYGVCLRSGKGEGSRCYMYTDDRYGDFPYLWLQKVDKDDDHRCGWEPHIVHYKQDVYTDAIQNSADEKCRIRCARSEQFPWGDRNSIRKIVNQTDDDGKCVFNAKSSCTSCKVRQPLGQPGDVSVATGEFESAAFANDLNVDQVPKPWGDLKYYCGVLCGPNKEDENNEPQ